MARDITEHDRDIIINCGAFRYDAPKMANVLDWSEKEVQKEFENHKSDFFKLYQRGADRADYVIDQKLFELAQTGDLKALEAFETRKADRSDER